MSAKTKEVTQNQIRQNRHVNLREGWSRPVVDELCRSARSIGIQVDRQEVRWEVGSRQEHFVFAGQVDMLAWISDTDRKFYDAATEAMEAYAGGQPAPGAFDVRIQPLLNLRPDGFIIGAAEADYRRPDMELSVGDVQGDLSGPENPYVEDYRSGGYNQASDALSAYARHARFQWKELAGKAVSTAQSLCEDALADLRAEYQRRTSDEAVARALR